MRPEPNNSALIDWVSPVNWHHPLNRNLVRWWKALAGATGGRTLHELCYRDDGTLINADMTTVWRGRVPEGGSAVIKVDGIDDRLSLAYGVNVGTDDVSIFTRVIPRTISQNRYVLGGATNSFAFGFGTNSGRFNVAKTGVANGPSATTTLVAGVAYSVGATMDNFLTANNVWLYTDGKLDGTGTFNVDFSAASDALASLSTAGSFLWSGEIEEIRLYVGRKLTDADHFDLHQEAISGCPHTLNRIRRRTINAPAAGTSAMLLRMQTEGLYVGSAM
jgi:hypothetical protein